MLELRPNCEHCDCDLAPEAEDAFICSFECTFCRGCAEHLLQFTCPNCAGVLVNRPPRTGSLLSQYPASTQRVTKQD